MKLAFNNITKMFGTKRAVQNLNMEVCKGQVVGLLGPNGAGKSTSMKMATGYHRPTSGTITLAGFDVWKAPLQAKQHLGYLPERAPVYSDSTCMEYLCYIARLRGIKGARLKYAVDTVIDACSLHSVRQQFTNTLSKGFTHRLCLAQSLLGDPEVLIFDEPTDGLDPNQKQEVRDLIDRIRPNKAIIISTHILEEVEAVCTEVFIMNKGECVFSGKPEELQAVSANKHQLNIELITDESQKLITLLRTLTGVTEVKTVHHWNKRLKLELFLSEAEGTLINKILPLIHEAAETTAAAIQEISCNNGNAAKSFRLLTDAK